MLRRQMQHIKIWNRVSWIFVILAIFLLGCGEGTSEKGWPTEQKLPDLVDFNFHVKPILSDKCFACHGPDMANQKADLRLDTEEGAFKTLLESGGYPIVPGDLEHSMVYQRVTSTDPDIKMPPPEFNVALSEYEIEVIKKWIEQGAEYKKHWAFTAPSEVEIPKIKEKDWARNPIDNFVADKWIELGLQQAPEATKEELIRRVTFDLIGLPPTLEEVDDFVSDDSADAFEKVVDRLLESPHYGERMASKWLDVARYADSHGYQDDRPRTMWPWRDWVIKAYNDNLPYDDFVTWQLAGDLLPDPTFEQKLATGFNRNHGITQEGGVIEEEYLTEYVADRVQTFGTAFMGLTMQCARCHDHKYDPLSQKDFFQVYAFFNNINEKGRISYFDLAPKPAMKYENELLEKEISDIKKMVAKLEEDQFNFELEIEDRKLKNWYKTLDWEELKTEKLESHYKMDFQESGSLKDEVTKTLAGTLNDKLDADIPYPSITEGKLNKAIEFNGKNTLVIGDVGDFGHNEEFSLGGWINSLKKSTLKAGLLSRRNGELSQGGYGIYLDTDNSFVFELIHSQKHKVEVKTKTKIPINEWTNVFATYDGSGKASGVKLFVNGAQQKTIVVSDNLEGKNILVGNPVTVGNWMTRAINKSGYGGFIGSIDEVFLYGREISPLEIKYLIGSKPDFDRSLVYRMYLDKESKEWNQLKEKLSDVRGKDTEIPYVMIMEESDSIKPAYILDRGVYDAKTEVVERDTPEAILEFSKDLPQNRLGLAKWLFDKKNPLTSRVTVNRIWQTLFGKGLVETPEDFGNQGALPSHPKLLDWLALDFMDNGWDIKRSIKMMVMTSTYRQSSRVSEKNYRMDPENRYLSRGPYKKHTAEMMRDQALVASGLLHDKIGGKWVKPYQPAGIWKELANQIGENKYRAGKGPDLYRRSIYTYWKRTIPVPSMLTFDASERAMCTVKRQATSTPLQSLVLLNDPQYIEASRVLAEQVVDTAEAPSEWIKKTFKRVISRLPSEKEVELLMEIYDTELARFNVEANNDAKIIAIGASKVDKEIDKSKLAAMTVVASAIFNLDEAKHS
ncbi:DUF1553 domain-containing protein [Pareuzebyella sediminis]|uniref:DUF1553 domain-containing protein n=1 Tax=Pareuzebyella sediminis TaxID=2607998 RepID=UPI0011F00C99|nr:DUF1553 domain-containing protein [Pareuzebyella sediminis]